jgi:L-ascorbate metabolism protein UlaG (beta-lactamase superfamily)
MEGWNILCDPVSAIAVLPASGSSQTTPPPLHRQELVSHRQKNRPDLTLISHNHYDHLIWRPSRHFQHHAAFCVPLGLREWFHKHIIATTTISLMLLLLLWLSSNKKQSWSRMNKIA